MTPEELERRRCAGREELFLATGPGAYKAAVKVCNGLAGKVTACPVKEACLAEALRAEGTLTAHYRALVYGGLKPAARARLVERTARPTGRPKQPCGTRTAYVAGCRCVPCADANRAYGRAQRAAAKERAA